jgi:hypothetical protein
MSVPVNIFEALVPLSVISSSACNWQIRYYAMKRDFARAVWNAYCLNPCQTFYWYYTETVDGVWGSFLWVTDEDALDANWKLARPEHIPRNMTIEQLIGWIEEVSGGLPIIGD